MSEKERAFFTDKAVEYPYPLRPDFTARLILPRNLSTAEAKRLAAMLETLVIEASEETSHGR